MARQSLSPMDALGDEQRFPVRHAGTMTHLKFLRKKNGYTLETLAKATNISISYLSRLESGSRRLNTDLIRRLSHAFGCEPSELLQDVSHDKHLITGVAFQNGVGSAKLSKRQILLGMRQSEQLKDIPVYCLSTETTDNGSKVVLLRSAPVDWRYRPGELAGKDVFALKSSFYFKPYFSDTAVLYLSGVRNYIPECSVVLATKNGSISLKKVWSVTPTNIQICEYGDIEGLKSGEISPDKLETVNNDDISEIYRIIGFSDFDVA